MMPFAWWTAFQDTPAAFACRPARSGIDLPGFSPEPNCGASAWFKGSREAVDNSGTPRSGPKKGVMGSLIKKRRKKIRKHKLKKRRRQNRHKKRVR